MRPQHLATCISCTPTVTLVGRATGNTTTDPPAATSDVVLLATKQAGTENHLKPI